MKGEAAAAEAQRFPDLASTVSRAARQLGLFQHEVETLEAEIGPHVARSVAFYLAGCRHSDGA